MTTVLWSFLADIWKTMKRDPEARERLMPYWRPTKCLFAIIGAAKDREGIELRQAMEEVIQRDLPLRDRAHALVPLLRPHSPNAGGTLH
jgi:hypothetical protein